MSAVESVEAVGLSAAAEEAASGREDRLWMGGVSEVAVSEGGVPL